MVVAAIIFDSFFMTASDPAEIGVSRLLPARFHAHFVLGLAGRSGVVLHASSLLLTAHFAAGLGLGCIAGSIKAGKQQ